MTRVRFQLEHTGQHMQLYTRQNYIMWVLTTRPSSVLNIWPERAAWPPGSSPGRWAPLGVESGLPQTPPQPGAFTWILSILNLLPAGWPRGEEPRAAPCPPRGRGAQRSPAGSGGDPSGLLLSHCRLPPCGLESLWNHSQKLAGPRLSGQSPSASPGRKRPSLKAGTPPSDSPKFQLDRGGLHLS